MRNRKSLIACLMLTGAIILWIFVTASGWQDVAAQGDTEPPHLVSVQVEPAFIDTSFSDQPITITVRVTDNLAGFSFGRVGFARFNIHGGSALPGFDIRFSPSDLISGTVNNGVFSATRLLPQHSAEGRWYVDNTYLEDETSNTCGWSRPFEEWEPCAVIGDLPYFVNVNDSSPPATATPTVTPTATPDLIATETAISQHIATAVAATLTAVAHQVPDATATPQPGDLYLPTLKN